jgi:metal-dependent hydrolase (beta-lactamase superfamily II)
MTSPSTVKLVYGGIGLAGKSKEEVNEILRILEKHNVHEIETSPSHVSLHLLFQSPY